MAPLHLLSGACERHRVLWSLDYCSPTGTSLHLAWESGCHFTPRTHSAEGAPVHPSAMMATWALLGLLGPFPITVDTDVTPELDRMIH